VEKEKPGGTQTTKEKLGNKKSGKTSEIFTTKTMEAFGFESIRN
jgi:hypothetical protein